LSNRRGRNRARALGAAASLCALAAFALVALVGCGGNGGAAKQTVDPHRYELNPNPTVKQQVGMDPDQEPEGGMDALVVLTSLGHGRYQLRITNTTEIGFINSFTWVAPSQFTITHVTASSRGSCRLDGGNIVCDGQAIPPPKCTCLPGGTMTIAFTARVPAAAAKAANQQRGVVGGYLRLQHMTPVPYLIPSYQGAKGNIDLPICKRGQSSTNASPCVHSG
jgi:hypothetical protein